VVNNPSTVLSDSRTDAVAPAAISAEAQEIVGRLDAELLPVKHSCCESMADWNREFPVNWRSLFCMFG